MIGRNVAAGIVKTLRHGTTKGLHMKAVKTMDEEIMNGPLKSIFTDYDSFINKFKDPLTGMSFLMIGASLKLAESVGYLKEEGNK